MTHLMKRLMVAAGLFAVSSLAFAHVAEGHSHMHDGLTGFMHPFLGLDHMAVMLAVGIWSALSTRRVWIAPLSFAATLYAGALLAQNGWAFAGVEPMIAASLLVIGLLLLSRSQLPQIAAATLVAGFALFHGAAHGAELASSTALLGMLLGTVVLHAIGIMIGMTLKQRSPWFQRFAGLAVALIGTQMAWGLLA